MKFLQKIRQRFIQLHDIIIIDKIQLLKGKISILYNLLLYPNFKIEKPYWVWGKLFIRMYEPNNQFISIGKELRLVSNPYRAGITLFSPSKITTFNNSIVKIGNHVGLSGTVISCRKSISIGDYTMIAPNVIILDTDFHPLWPPENRWTEQGLEYDKEVVIGSNVWIGMNTIILKGSIIGDNSIIGAGSVVSGTIPPNVIAGGNPAKVIREMNISKSK
jgi:acetyltransferase-like isoleucine patch superfamily enzyme